MSTSGIQPMHYKVLVKPIAVETKTKGGLIMPEQVVEKNSYARTDGVIDAMSEHAFSYAKWSDESAKPKVGDHVFFSRYSATAITGVDGEEYWLLQDESIAGVINAAA